jgi:hypothetical protein
MKVEEAIGQLTLLSDAVLGIGSAGSSLAENSE